MRSITGILRIIQYKQLLEIIEKVNIIEKNSIDYSIFTLPYIRERKVLCNTKLITHQLMLVKR